MARDLVVGETYSLSEIAGMVSDAAMVPSDRIVTDNLAWSRMTVERLMEWLQTALEAEEIGPQTIVFVDSDPEGNGLHPMRAAASLCALGPDGTMDEEATEVTLPAPAVWFGVGY